MPVHGEDWEGMSLFVCEGYKLAYAVTNKWKSHRDFIINVGHVTAQQTDTPSFASSHVLYVHSVTRIQRLVGAGLIPMKLLSWMHPPILIFHWMPVAPFGPTHYLCTPLALSALSSLSWSTLLSPPEFTPSMTFTFYLNQCVSDMAKVRVFQFARRNALYQPNVFHIHVAVGSQIGRI